MHEAQILLPEFVPIEGAPIPSIGAPLTKWELMRLTMLVERKPNKVKDNPFDVDPSKEKPKKVAPKTKRRVPIKRKSLK